MSNNFDKKFREKFEAFEPEFEEKYWQDFLPQLHPKTPFWPSLYKPLGILTIATCIGYLFYQNNQLLNENKLLQANNQSLITKNIITENKDIARTRTESVNAAEQEESLTSKTVKITNTPKAEDKNEVIYPNTKSQDIRDNNKPIANQKREEITNVEIQNVGILKTIFTNDVSLQKEMVTNNEAKVADNQAITQTPNRAWIVVNFLQHQQTVKSLDKKLPINPSFEFYPSIKKVVAKQYKKSIGASVSLKETEASVGLIAAYRFGKHWQLLSGISFAHQGSQDFKDENDFKKSRKEDFKSKFEQPLPNNIQFKDIHQTQTTWLIPLGLNYQRRLYRRFSGVATVGANITLQQRNYFDYKYTDANTNPKRGTLKIQEQGRFIHNGHIGLGVDWTKNRFTLRALSYWNTDEQKNYKHSSNNGITLQGFYNF